MDASESAHPTCFLVDNGSLQPAATLELRRIAAALSARVGHVVEPVSLLHSSSIAPERLQGRRAENFEPALRARCAAGRRKFFVTPLFFGPSAALTEYIPQRVAALANEFSDLRVHVAPPLVDVRDTADTRVARILADHVRAIAREQDLARPAVILVDHGSPQRAVAAVRDHVATQLSAELGAAAARMVIAASMERREGADFAFNEPLLETALAQLPLHGDGSGGDDRRVIVAPLFFSPGRHAGAGGDIEAICREAEQRRNGLRVFIAPLVGGHPLLIDVLADRWREGMSALK